MKQSWRQSRAVSPATHRDYLQRARSILRRFSHEHDGLDPEEYPGWFEAWFNRLLAELGKSTQRQYRAAVRHYIDYRGGRTALSIRSGAEQRAWEADQGVARLAAKPKGTSSGKAKHIKPHELKRLCDELRSKRSRIAHLAADLLIAGYQFGLRPNEWAEAHFVFLDSAADATEYDSRLVVRNAKATQGRSFGAHRTLRFSRGSMDPADLKACMRCNLAMKVRALKRRRERPPGDENVDPCGLRGMQQHLAEARKRRGYKRKITLYSARHQFAANAKAAGLSQIEIAALMGHGSDETATKHYGKRRSGRRARSFDVEPSEQDVEAVERFNAERLEGGRESPEGSDKEAAGENRVDDSDSDDDLIGKSSDPSPGTSMS